MTTIIIGIGCGGCKILSKFDTDIKKAFIGTDKTDISQYSGLLVGEKICQGYGTGGDVKTGELALFENRQEFLDLITPYDHIIIIAPFGGGTSCGCTKKMVELALYNDKHIEVLTSFPFSFEGELRKQKATETYMYLKELCEITVLKNVETEITTSTTVKNLFNQQDEKYLTELYKKIKEIK
jgi:cell division protein FtsZ